MKHSSLQIALLLLVSLSLVSCVTYRSADNGFTAAPAAVAGQKKAFLRQMSITMMSYGAFDEHIKNSVNQIMAHITAARPDIFTDQEEGAVPIELSLASTNYQVDVGEFLFLSVLTLGMVPNHTAHGWNILSRASTTADFPYQLTVSEVETLEICKMESFLLLPVIWPFFLFGPGKTAVNSSTWEEMYEKNWFLTQEFADNMAYLAAKLLARVQEYEQKQPGDADYRVPGAFTPAVQIKAIAL